MPTYTYRCTKCGEEIEVFQSMSDPPLKRCKVCRGALKRTFHPVGIVLKGSGFHKTDYRSSKPSKSSPDGEKKSDTTEKKSESKSDSKAETKPASSDKKKASSDS